jgi:hypothetical protein
MSWKSIVSAGLLCILASPAWAVPSLSVTRSYNQAQGAIIWEVRVTQDTLTSLGIELPMQLAGYAATPLTAGLPFLRDSGGDATNGAVGNTWYYNETAAGSGVLLWNTQQIASNQTQNVGANPFTGNQTEGLWIDTATRRLFAALGSDINMPDVDGTLAGRQIATLHIATSDGILSWTNAVLAESGVTTTVSGSLGSIVARGDMNGNGVRNFQDATPFGLALTNPSGYAAQFPGLNRSARGDMNGNGVFNFQDATPFGNCLVNAATCLAPPTSGGGSGGLSLAGSVVPEPTSIGLVGFAVLGLLGIYRRNR